MKSLFFSLIYITLTQTLHAQPINIDTFITRYVKEHDFNGSILLSRNNKIIYQKSFGLANRPFNVPNKNDTKYKIASITKLFTVVLIMQLQEEGKLDVNKTINAYLPNYKGEGAGKVTIHQLLNHTSGMRNRDTITSLESALKNGLGYYQQALHTDELLTLYCSDTLTNKPGEVFSYNNAEYIILGKIIERLYNKPYDQVLKEKILQPLRMKNTGMARQDAIIPGLADTYFYRDDIRQLANDLPVYIENWYASGAIYSTTSDLLAFANALYSFKLLKEGSVNIIATPGLDKYGYGVWVYDSKYNDKSYQTIKRPGRIMGAQGQLVHYRSEKLTVIILSNTGTTDLDSFESEISKRLIN